MNDHEFGVDELASISKQVSKQRQPERRRGLDRLLQEINSFPRLATEGVDYKPLWLVTEPAERPNLRLVA